MPRSAKVHKPRHLITQPNRRASANQRGYTYAWQQASRAFLRAYPHCADPFAVHGELPVAATLVDHVVPHRGNRKLFWDRTNWQGLCIPCHARKTGMGQ